jgi:hypothetical protein
LAEKKRAEKKRVVVAGARGVFGSLLVTELADSYDVIATTRETLDLRDVAAVGHAARSAFAFLCAAGPFQQLDRAIVRAVVDAGAHWLDIADDERWFFDLVDDATLDALARERGVVVMPGLSTLPAISCALVRRIGAPKHVSITLYIGNDNAKGAAAIASGAALQAPDRELLRRDGIDAEVRTRFEMPGVRIAMRVLAMVPVAMRMRIARNIARLAKMFPFGTRGGYVEVRAGERVERVSRSDQRMAVLPLVFALRHLPQPGVHAPTVLEAEQLLQFVRE